MSLIRMLTATRSLSDVKDEPSPYRMTEQGLLPKFGPRKKARWDAQVKAGGDARPPEEKGAENLGEGNGDRKDAGCSLKSESSREPKGNAERGTRSAEPGGLAGWWQRLFGRKRRQQPHGPVQGEFTLDLVKVVRNDLSDGDASAPEPKKNKPKVECAQVEESVFGAPRD